MDWWVVGLRLMGLGWYVAACIILGVLGGLGLDKWIGITPLFTLLGTVLGTVLAFWGLYKMVQPALYGSKSLNGKDTRGKS
jgi:ATP synthase protein I